jgi:serine/threonine-protein kinase
VADGSRRGDGSRGRRGRCPARALALAAFLTGASAPAPAGTPAADTLEARRLWARRTAPDLAQAEGLLRHALARDPTSAPAHSALADVLALRYDYDGARREALRALELDPDSAEAHASLGFIRLHADWDWPGSEAALGKALALDPDLPQAHLWRAIALEVVGRHGEAVAAAERALELDREAFASRAGLGYRLYWARRYDEAIRALEAALALDPDSTSARYFIARCLVQLGRHEDAAAAFALARALAPHDLNLQGAEAYARAVAGRRAEAAVTLADLAALAGRGLPLASQVAGLHAALGDPQAALRWLERAAEARETPLLWLQVDPRFDPLRAEPRFRDLVRRLGLPSPAGR